MCIRDRDKPQRDRNLCSQLRSAPPLNAPAARIGGGGSPSASRPSTLLGELSPAPGPLGGPRHLVAFSGWPPQARSKKGRSATGSRAIHRAAQRWPIPMSILPKPIPVWAERSWDLAGKRPVNSLWMPLVCRAAPWAWPGLASSRVPTPTGSPAGVRLQRGQRLLLLCLRWFTTWPGPQGTGLPQALDTNPPLLPQPSFSSVLSFGASKWGTLSPAS